MLMLAGAAAADPNLNLPPQQWQDYGRKILKELIEIDTTHAHGSTGAAHALEAEFLEAGFDHKDVTVLAPADHPTKGNVVVRLRGSGKAKPVLYIGHLDVVEAERADWKTDPFKLVEQDGYLYGRGTIDMKGQDAEIATALVRLKKEGFVPDRDIIAAFTADEEAGGDANGVQWLLAAHRDLVDAGFVINQDVASEGPLTIGGRKFYDMVITSEKQYMTFAWDAADGGGHSSRPTDANPIYHVVAALDRLAHYRFPLHLTDTTRKFFAVRAEHEPGPLQADMRALSAGKADAAAIDRLSAVVDNNIMMRSTCVATQFAGGRSESALPTTAHAIIQCRVIPGESQADIEKTLLTLAGDPAIKQTVVVPAEPGPETAPDPKILGTVERVAHGMWPQVAVAPSMSPGASDSLYARKAGIPSFGVDGIFLPLEESRLHGRDERVGIAEFNEGLEFSYRLMKEMGRLP